MGNQQYAAPSDTGRESLEDKPALPTNTLETDRPDSGATATAKRAKSSDSSKITESDQDPKEYYHSKTLTERTEASTPSSTVDVTDTIRPQLTENFPHENGSGNDLAMIPPYSGIGSVRGERYRRNPRPTYLKERKSAWLPDTFAAPPDGVITPDWLE